MNDLETHFRSLEEGLHDLERFLLSGEVFWPRGNLPSLSLGEITWSRDVLASHRDEMDAGQLERLEVIERGLDATRDKWAVAWEQKAAAELRARVNLWKAFLYELQDSGAGAATYSQEVRNRALAQKLAKQSEGVSEVEVLEESLASLDSLLRSRFDTGDFAWEPSLEAEYPRDDFWFLYGAPRS